MTERFWRAGKLAFHVSTKDAVNGHHVTGTPYNWRHGWEPLNPQTAQRHGKPWRGSVPSKKPSNIPKLPSLVGNRRALEAAVEQVASGVELPEGVRVAHVTTTSTGLWELKLVDADGDFVAGFSRKFVRGKNEDDHVKHDFATVDPKWQRNGIASKINKAFEEWYLDSGVKFIKLSASSGGDDNGGYTWARAGYDWDPDIATASMARSPLTDIQDEAFDTEDDDLADQVTQMLKRVKENNDNPHAWPTPAEIAMLGYTPGAVTWPGRRAMEKNSWAGRKKLIRESSNV